MYKYKFPIGDWSCDGHEKCEVFVAQGTKPVEELREVHFKCKEVLGFDIGDMCRKYEESKIKPEIIEKIIAAGISTPENLDYIGSEDLFLLWLNILNHIDPELKLEEVPDPTPTINFYGDDDQKRHLRVPGYGLFE